MCTYCGCRSIDSVSALTDEHDASLELLADARRAVLRGDADQAVCIAKHLLCVLAPHTAVEEQAVFPAMAEEYPDYVASLLDEHRRIELGLNAAATGQGQVALSALTEAAETLRGHIRREEDGLYPATLTSLDAEDWERAERVRDRVHPGRRPLNPLLPSA